MKLATKQGWKSYNTSLWCKIASCNEIDPKIKVRIKSNEYGLYETPKTYTDSIAYNDGSWLIYNTCRQSGSKTKTKVHCQDRNELIRHLYGYIIFLYKCGISRLEAQVYVVRYIIYKLTYDEGMFDCNQANKKFIDEKIMSIYSKDIEDFDCSRVDERKYAIDPKLLKYLNKSDYTKLQKKIEKQLTYSKIEKLYNPELSLRKNSEYMKEQGLDVSKDTIKRWLQEKCII